VGTFSPGGPTCWPLDHGADLGVVGRVVQELMRRMGLPLRRAVLSCARMYSVRTEIGRQWVVLGVLVIGCSYDWSTNGKMDASVESQGGRPGDDGATPDDSVDAIVRDGQSAGTVGDSTADFRVVASDPATGSAELVDLAPIHLAFSAALDTSSVTSQTMRVLLEGEAVAGTVRADSEGADFVPLYPWSLGANYAVELSSSIRAVDGTTLAASSFEVSARDGQWTASALQRSYQVPDLASSPSGLGAFVFFEFQAPYAQGSLPGVKVRTINQERKWSGPIELTSDYSSNNLPSIAIGDMGGVAFSYRFDSRRLEIYSRGSGSIWARQTWPADGPSESVLVTQSNEVRVVYFGADAALGRQLWISTTPQSGTEGGSSRFIADAPGGTKVRHALVGNGSQVLWEQANGGVAVVRAIALSTVAQPAALIQTLSDPARTASGMTLTANTSGEHAFALWQQQNGSVDAIWAARYTTGTWEPRLLVSDGDTNTGLPSVGVDSRGRALAAWPQGGSGAGLSLFSSDRLVDT